MADLPEFEEFMEGTSRADADANIQTALKHANKKKTDIEIGGLMGVRPKQIGRWRTQAREKGIDFPDAHGPKARSDAAAEKAAQPVEPKPTGHAAARAAYSAKADAQAKIAANHAQNNKTDAEIKGIMNISDRTLRNYRNRAQELGHDFPTNTPTQTPAWHATQAHVLAHGGTDTQISAALNIPISTVRTHRKAAQAAGQDIPQTLGKRGPAPGAPKAPKEKRPDSRLKPVENKSWHQAAMHAQGEDKPDDDEIAARLNVKISSIGSMRSQAIRAGVEFPNNNKPRPRNIRSKTPSQHDEVMDRLDGLRTRDLHRHPDLNQTENEVRELAKNRYTDREISDFMDFNGNDVSVHRNRILRKGVDCPSNPEVSDTERVYGHIVANRHPTTIATMMGRPLNSVYVDIVKLKRKGLLPADWTSKKMSTAAWDRGMASDHTTGSKMESIESFEDFLMESAFDRAKFADEIWAKHRDSIIERAHEYTRSGRLYQAQIGEHSHRAIGPIIQGSQAEWRDHHSSLKNLRQSCDPTAKGFDTEDGQSVSEFREHLAKDQFVNELIAAAPKTAGQPNPKAMRKMAHMYANNEINRVEDITGQIGPLMQKADQLRKNGNLTGTDTAIYDTGSPHFQSLRHYRDLIDRHVDSLPKKNPTEGLEQGKDYDIVHDGEEATIYHAKTQAAATKLAFCPHTGKEAQWCTRIAGTGGGGQGWFHSYAKDGPILIVHPKQPAYEGEMYQFHHDSQQTMDENDEEVTTKGMPSTYDDEDEDHYYDAGTIDSGESAMDRRFPKDKVGEKMWNYTAHDALRNHVDKVVKGGFVNGMTQRDLRDEWSAPGMHDQLPEGHQQALTYHFEFSPGQHQSMVDGAAEKWIASQSKIHPLTATAIAERGTYKSKLAMVRHPGFTPTNENLSSILDHDIDTGTHRPKGSEIHPSTLDMMSRPALQDRRDLFQALADHPVIKNSKDSLGTAFIHSRLMDAQGRLNKFDANQPKTESVLESFEEFLGENAFDPEKFGEEVWKRQGPALIKRAHEAAFSRLPGGLDMRIHNVTPGRQSLTGQPSYEGPEAQNDYQRYGVWNEPHHTVAKMIRGSQYVDPHENDSPDQATMRQEHRDKNLSLAKRWFTQELMTAAPKTAGQPNSKAMHKMADMYGKGHIKRLEDITGQIGPLMQKVDFLRKEGHLQGEDSSVYDPGSKRFQTLKDFRDLVGRHSDKFDKPKSKLDQLTPGVDYDIVHDGEEATIYHAKTQAAATQLAFCPHTGKEAQWCTRIAGTGGGGQGWFHRYNQDGPIFVVHPKAPKHEGEMYQYHKDSGQTMDENDEDVPSGYHEDHLNGRFPKDLVGDKLAQATAAVNLKDRPNMVLESGRDQAAKAAYFSGVRETLRPGWQQAFDYHFKHNGYDAEHNFGAREFLGSQERIHPQTVKAILANKNPDALHALVIHPSMDHHNADLDSIHRAAGFTTASGRVQSYVDRMARDVHDTALEDYHGLYTALVNHPEIGNGAMKGEVDAALAQLTKERDYRIANGNYSPRQHEVKEGALPSFEGFLVENAFDQDKFADEIWSKHRDDVIRRAHEGVFAGQVKDVPVGVQSDRIHPEIENFQNEGKPPEEHRPPISGHWADSDHVAMNLRMAHAPGYENKSGTPLLFDDAKKRFTQHLVNAAPVTAGQPNVKAMRKMADMYAKGHVKRIEDFTGQIGPLMQKADQLRKNGNLSGNDTGIYDTGSPHFQTMEHYRDLVDRLGAKLPIKNHMEGLVEGEDYHVVADGQEATIYHALTQKAATALAFCPHTGKEAQWCTRIAPARGQGSWFGNYSKDGPILVIHPKRQEHPGEMYQYHMASGQVMDEHDHGIAEWQRDEDGHHMSHLDNLMSPQDVGTQAKQYTIRHMIQNEPYKLGTMRTHDMEHDFVTQEIEHNPSVLDGVPAGQAQALRFKFRPHNYDNHAETATKFVQGEDTIHPETKAHIISSESPTAIRALVNHPKANLTADDMANISFRESPGEMSNLGDTWLEAKHNLFQDMMKHPAMQGREVEGARNVIGSRADRISQERDRRKADPDRGGYEPEDGPV